MVEYREEEVDTGWEDMEVRFARLAAVSRINPYWGVAEGVAEEIEEVDDVW